MKKNKSKKVKSLKNPKFRKLRFRKAVFVVVYARVEGKIKYLILRREKHWKGWEFPKGGIEFLETKMHAVKREVREETGLNILEIKKFDVYGEYNYERELEDRKNVVGQDFSLYSAEVEFGWANIDEKEHSDFSWVYFDEAWKKLKWKNQKKCLRIVNDFLTEKNNPESISEEKNEK